MFKMILKKIFKIPIIGTYSVVKGKVADNSIIVGNPAKVIGNTMEYAKKHFEIKDYYTEKICN